MDFTKVISSFHASCWASSRLRLRLLTVCSSSFLSLFMRSMSAGVNFWFSKICCSLAISCFRLSSWRSAYKKNPHNYFLCAKQFSRISLIIEVKSQFSKDKCILKHTKKSDKKVHQDKWINPLCSLTFDMRISYSWVYIKPLPQYHS